MRNINFNGHRNQVVFGVPRQFTSTLKGKNLVITEDQDEFRVREAIISDTKTVKISSKNQVSYTPNMEVEEVLGKWDYEIEAGELIIYR